MAAKIYPDEYGNVKMSGGGSDRKNREMFAAAEKYGWKVFGLQGMGSKLHNIIVPYADVAVAKSCGFSVNQSHQKSLKEEYSLFMPVQYIDILDLSCEAPYQYGITYPDFIETFPDFVFDGAMLFEYSKKQKGKYVKISKSSTNIFADFRSGGGEVCAWLRYMLIVQRHWRV